jgi:hypothetical protein
MAGNGEFERPADQPAVMRAERTAGESARRAWSKPTVQRISLERTMSGSNPFDAPSIGSLPA